MSFSERHGYGAAGSTNPTDWIREDAPEGVRVGFLAIVEKLLGPRGLRSIACKVLRKRPEPGNWSDYPNVWNEVQELVYGAPWYQFYDIVEAAIEALKLAAWQSVTAQLNQLFAQENIAWHIVDAQVVLRTGDVGDQIVEHAVKGLEEASRPTAASELRKAMHALSQRPKPDTRDAVRCALGAMEAVARDITGNRSATLGDILKAHRTSGTLLPTTLMQAFEKAWGFASETARHVDETKGPTLEEAVLVVGLVAAGVAYLAQK